jgi:hypothetical protein
VGDTVTTPAAWRGAVGVRRRLALHDPYPLAELARLRPLADRLDILDLYGVDDVSSAAVAVGDRPAEKLRITPC